jgi:hypothetical protein
MWFFVRPDVQIDIVAIRMGRESLNFASPLGALLLPSLHAPDRAPQITRDLYPAI